ncbi:hypothetical protein RJD38_20035 [Vibrio scophthalmi]|uniref:Uncharacterized protein n=1 Tax=Vibrio scophthalmi TaxID=45658 RepID=A0A1C7FHL8_9VIBR|nr:hypothetical protein [Vibrio scophthalmi]ANU38499.1 hypothetical protein VSVS05_03461 [Vibrio scophthalmi]
MEQYFIEKLIQSDYVIIDLFMTIFQLIIQMHLGGRVFYISIAAAVTISILVVWVIGLIVRNVNTDYDAGIGFAFGTVISFATTFFTVILLFSLQFTEPVVKVVIKGWELSLIADQQWRNETFRDAYENVASLKNSQGHSLENFTDYPHPDIGGSTIPGRSDQARLMAIDTYLEGALDNFDSTMPILSWILSAGSGSAKKEIFQDMSENFENNPNYEMASAIAIAGNEISDELVAQAGKIMLIASVCGVLVFILINLIITALLTWGALRKINEEF